ncbi:hypothetical protein DFJ73DRAFT_38315 [Zopfochytrium polystomum]|nr:hypothetical protein DFJ73DRAFT_38315 [Zopfochytrium polystomum]
MELAVDTMLQTISKLEIDTSDVPVYKAFIERQHPIILSTLSLCKCDWQTEHQSLSLFLPILIMFLDQTVENLNQMLKSWLAAIPTSKPHICIHSSIFQFVETMIVISSIFSLPLRLIGTFTLTIFVAICQASATILYLCLALSMNIWICFTILATISLNSVYTTLKILFL